LPLQRFEVGLEIRLCSRIQDEQAASLGPLGGGTTVTLAPRAIATVVLGLSR